MQTYHSKVYFWESRKTKRLAMVNVSMYTKIIHLILILRLKMEEK